MKHEEIDSVSLFAAVLLAGEQGQDGGEAALKGIREFFGSRRGLGRFDLLVFDASVVAGGARKSPGSTEKKAKSLECSQQSPDS